MERLLKGRALIRGMGNKERVCESEKLLGVFRECNANMCELCHEGYCIDEEASKICTAKSNEDLKTYDEDWRELEDDS